MLAAVALDQHPLGDLGSFAAGASWTSESLRVSLREEVGHALCLAAEAILEVHEICREICVHQDQELQRVGGPPESTDGVRHSGAKGPTLSIDLLRVGRVMLNGPYRFKPIIC